MRRRTVHVSFGAVAAVCGVIAIWYAVQLTQANRINAAIASATPTRNGTNIPNIPQAQLARAITLAESGKFTAALKAYKALLDAPDEVRLPALYNLGNLNMREALKNGPGEAQRALPLIELAKQSYRDDLRSNPADWDARYNLERALWLSPEYDDPILERNQAPVRSEHAMSTLQGAKIDLP
ncbi:MAG: mxaK protein [Gammaproteobacteria bacterium]|nr:mxaK protein [Gammaproteobacteria bacterium]